MTMDRRGFLAAGAGLGAGGAALAMAAPGRPANALSLAEFGIRPDPLADQGAALQAAFDEAGRKGEPVALLPGVYRTERTLRLPRGVSLFGVAGASVVTSSSGVVISAEPGSSFRLEGISLAGAAGGSAAKPLAAFEDCDVTISDCAFSGGNGVDLRRCRASIETTHFRNLTNGVLASEARGIRISGSRFEDIGNWAITVTTAVGAPAAQILHNSIVRSRVAGIVAGGGALITGNAARQCGYGLILGGESAHGGVMATQNHVVDCNVGIGCWGVGEYVFASLNMITGAKAGAIRALIDGKPSGPDLTQGSAEAFRNLTVAGNVAL